MEGQCSEAQARIPIRSQPSLYFQDISSPSLLLNLPGGTIALGTKQKMEREQ